MPKALVAYDGKLLVERAAETLREAGVALSVVVLGAEAPRVSDVATGLPTTVINPDWPSGLGSSLCVGLQALAETTASAVVVLLVDMPHVTASAVRRVTALASSDALVMGGYGTRRGHPVLLGRDHWAGVIETASGDKGARDYLRAHASELRVVPVDDVADDFDLDVPLRALLDDLYAEGKAFDAGQSDRRDRRRNLEPDAAELLTMVLRIGGAKDIVEIGTSNGYSTLWLADATGGTVTTVDVAPPVDARANAARAGLLRKIIFETADGGDFLAARPDRSVDLLFLDADRPEYPGWWPHPKRVLRPGGVLAIDNVLSHPDEVAPFLRLIADDADFTATTVAVGKGLHLAVLNR
ncbi:NTP transferase domain-containing protein [Actinoplanes sp. NPDC051513]|uniref:NTP transferase domain-containing protein n=1 Tax=Actinoplanes sp. NPDC051513 TaxID=3363908 RepID=UPI0037BB9679